MTNDKLRRWRLVAGWTEGQVAERVRELVEAATGRGAPIDADYVSKLERGKITWPNRDYRAAFRQLFGASTDDELGFYSKRTRRDAHAILPGATAPHASHDDGERPGICAGGFVGEGAGAALEEVDPTQRRELLGMAAAVAFGAPLGEPVERIIAAADLASSPGRVGMGDVRDVQAITASLEELDHKTGGAPARRLVLSGLRWATGLHEGSTTPEVRASLNAAVAHLADLAAWTTFDSGLHAPARRLFVLGLHAAKEAADGGILAHVASGYARQEIYVGNVGGALDLLRLAQASADELPPAALSMLEVVKAQAYARRPDPAACVQHIRRAEDHYATAEPHGGPAWIAYFTQAKLEGDIASALYDLSRLTPGERDIAGRLATATAHYPDARARGKAIAAARLAALLYRQHQPAAAARAGHHALDVAAPVRSARLSDDLRTLAAAAEAHPEHDTTRALRQRIHTALAAAP